MPNFYGCKNCNVSIETHSPRKFHCKNCSTEMDMLATESWVFKCSSCARAMKGDTQAEPRTSPCPFCDDGIDKSLIRYRYTIPRTTVPGTRLP